MSDIFKSILAGIAATPIVLLLTIGVGLACGLNPHFLLVSVIITNVLGIILDRNSAHFFNIGAGLVILMFTYSDTIGMQSGYVQTLIIFTVPSIVFIILSFLKFNFALVPNRVIAILAFGIGMVVIIKQLPNAFGYVTAQPDFSFVGEEKSLIESSTIRNWVQLVLALSIPIASLIGHRFKKGTITLISAVFVALGLGFLLGYDTTPLQGNMLLFNEPFHLYWSIEPEIIILSIQNGVTVTIVMLLSFWMDYSMLSYNQKDNRGRIKKSLRTVGMGNLISGLFGVMPANISLIDSLSIKAFGGSNWISKLPIILAFITIAIMGIPEFNIPLFAFIGVVIYIGILLIIKSWEILKELHWVDYIFTLIIGSFIVFRDLTSGFIVAMLYAGIYYLISRRKHKES